MSSKHGTCECKDGNYAKAAFGIQLFFLIVLITIVIGGFVLYNQFSQQIIDFFNQFTNLPTP